jgi:hypothetical protein
VTGATGATGAGHPRLGAEARPAPSAYFLRFALIFGMHVWNVRVSS